MGMDSTETIYILGAGAIGFPLAAYLAKAGQPVVAVRTSRSDVPRGTVTVTMQTGADRFSQSVDTISLAKLATLDGMVVVTSKAYANRAIAHALTEKAVSAPIVIMQNGVGVERPFLEASFTSIYRCVLYVTSQSASEYEFRFSPVAASPIGPVNGYASELTWCVEQLTTDAFPFRPDADIQREVWKKAIINAVFNSICPLLEVDNGVFARDATTARIAREIVEECVTLTDRLDVELTEGAVMEQLMQISARSEGQLISTLQDIRNGRQTEIEFLNIEMARIAASLNPELHLLKTELLGKMIVAKSQQQRN